MILDEIVARTKIRIGEIKGVNLLSIVKEEVLLKKNRIYITLWKKKK